jgi:flavorubredoxin
MKALIIYDSVSGNTEAIAKSLADSLKHFGVEVLLRCVDEANEGEIEEVEVIILGSPTHYRSPTLRIKQFLKKMESIDLKDKFGASFGSFGWSGEAPWLLRNAMRILGMKVMEETLRIKRAPEKKDLEECRKFAEKIVEFAKK